VGLNTSDHPLPEWGPSQEEILEASVTAVMASLDPIDSDGEASETDFDFDDNEGAAWDSFEDDEWETGLIETLDAVDRVDAYREVFQ
jgi:hypothetical protein